MSNAYYLSMVTDEERRDVEAIRVRVANGTATAADVQRLLEHMRNMEQENSDLAVLYSTTVDHATEVENELLRRNTEVSGFLANMSHELRTPLNAIIGYSEMVLDEARSQQLHDLTQDLERITGAGRHLLGLINDVLDLSKIEAGRLELLVEPLHVPMVVQQVVATLQPLARQRQNRLDVDVPPGVLNTDATRLRQVLINLLGNGLKFTRSGTVAVVARNHGAHWHFEVHDDGIGMSPDQLSGLFQPFRQATAETTRDFGGTGLGLALSRRLVRAMGGDIAVESLEGVGTTFTFDIEDRPDEDLP